MTLLYVHLILFQCWLELLFSHFLVYQGGSAFAKTSASFFSSSSPSWGSMATYPMTCTTRTQTRPRNCPSTRCLKSLPCFIRRRVWWSLKVLASTLCRRPNCASTCQTNIQNSVLVWLFMNSIALCSGLCFRTYHLRRKIQSYYTDASSQRRTFVFELSSNTGSQPFCKQ